MRRILLLTILITSQFLAKAQNIENKDGRLSLGLSFGQSNLSNNAAPNPENHRASGLAFNIDMKHLRKGVGKLNMRYEHKQLGDLIALIPKAIKNSNAVNRTESTPLSCGLIGWWNWTINLNEGNDFLLSAGFNLHDYFYGSYTKDDTAGNSYGFSTYEPQGWYWASGPSLAALYAPSGNIVLEATTSYSFSFWRPISLSDAKVDNDFKNPHWLQFNLGVLTNWGVFTQFSYNKIINRGNIPNNGKRWDYLIGYRFKI